MTSSCPEGLGLITNTSPFTCWCSLHATRIRLRRRSPPSPDLQIVGCYCCTHPHWSWPHPPPLRATWSWSWGWSLTSVGLCLRRRRPGSRGCLLTPWLKSYRAHGQYHRQVCHSMVMAARAGSDQLLPSTPDQLCFNYWILAQNGTGCRVQGVFPGNFQSTPTVQQQWVTRWPALCVRCDSAPCTHTDTHPLLCLWLALCYGNFTQLKICVIFTRILYVYCAFNSLVKHKHSIIQELL